MIKAEWIDVNGDGSLWKCSLCGETQCCKSNYCGNCGAKMDEEAPTVDVVSWKDFRDFLDDNTEDFDSIGKRFEALENQVGNLFRDSDTESDMLAEWRSATEDNIKRLDAVERLILINMMERWESLARKVEALEKENREQWNSILDLSNYMAPRLIEDGKMEQDNETD